MHDQSRVGREREREEGPEGKGKGHQGQEYGGGDLLSPLPLQINMGVAVAFPPSLPPPTTSTLHSRVAGESASCEFHQNITEMFLVSERI